MALPDPSPATRGRKLLVGIGLGWLAAVLPNFAQEQVQPKLYSVLASAEVQSEPARITLQWPADTNATSYEISRKLFSEGAWSPLATLAGSATQYVDDSVVGATLYEYQFIKTTNRRYTGYGYLASAIQAPLADERGKVILVVANTHATALAPELGRLEQDLVGDGWIVFRHDVSPDVNPAAVKALIQSDYLADPERVRAVLLFGRIPVPYSGAIAPDGHTNHFGAWPADVFYGELRGQWTDISVTATNAEKSRNWNVPGDGKFDQSTPPGEVLLEVGRVDLSNMTAFSNKTPARSELDLLRQYLQKNHNFRHGRLPVDRRALICDNFGDKGEDRVASSGWRNFSGFFGSEHIFEAGWSNYFPIVTEQSYLWTFASGGGQFYNVTGVGSSDDFALQDIRAVFTLWLGSYFGDWDTESNFLRAPLGSTTYTLVSAYAGFPQWLLHPMAVGETVGFCARVTQNNRPGGLYPPFNQGTNQVHIALHGDPTLRMNPVSPPADLILSNTLQTFVLAWSPSPDPGVQGYHVYRAASSAGPFTRLTGATPQANVTFDDSPPAGAHTYMVRAVKLEASASGTYFNASQGIFATGSMPGSPSADALSISVTSSKLSDVQLQVSGPIGQGFAVQISPDLRRWTTISSNRITSGTTVPLPVDLAPAPSARFYRAKAMD